MRRIFLLIILIVSVFSSKLAFAVSEKHEKNGSPAQEPVRSECKPKVKQFKNKAQAESSLKQKGWRPHTIKDGSAPIEPPK